MTENEISIIKWYIALFITATLFVLCVNLSTVHGAEPELYEIYTIDQIADAIYKAENSVKYPYGIKSIDTRGNKVYARRICKNTIRNNIRRWKKHRSNGGNKDYITFLWHRYCPPKANKRNRHWKKNVLYFLKKENDER